MLVALSAIDLTHRIVPNRIVLPAAAITLVAHTLIDPSPEWLIASVGASAFFLVAALAYPAGLGMGDVKLALLLGAMLGSTVMLAIMLGLARCARAVGRPARPAWIERAQDGDTARAVPRARRGRRALLGFSPPRGIYVPLSLSSR